jgi:hypothetical protein
MAGVAPWAWDRPATTNRRSHRRHQRLPRIPGKRRRSPSLGKGTFHRRGIRVGDRRAALPNGDGSPPQAKYTSKIALSFRDVASLSGRSDAGATRPDGRGVTPTERPEGGILLVMTTPPGTHPRPLTELFPHLRSRDDGEALRLDSEQVRFFEANGFVAGIRVLAGPALEAVRGSVERIRRGENPYLHLLYEVEEDYYRDPERNAFHCLGGWLVEPALHDLVFHPAATVPAAQLLGTERLRFWHDQVFYKPPRHPGVVAWHQDFSYWTRTLPMNHVTVNIVLDDTSPENGCLHYVPGSHRWPLLAPVSFGQDMEAFRDFLPAELREGFRPTPVALKAGEASFHHPLTVHGSYENRSSGPRRAAVLNFMGPDTRSAEGRIPLLKGTPVVPRGEVVEGDHFPIVLDLTALG